MNINILKHVFYASCRRSGLNNLGIYLQRNKLQILVYHGISDPQETKDYYIPDYFVYRDKFSEQMNFVRKKMRPISLTEAVSIMRTERKLPKNSVAITFDDGYMNNFSYALPILKQFNIPATVFLPTGYMDTKELFPFIKYALLTRWIKKGLLKKITLEQIQNEIFQFKLSPFEKFSAALGTYWERSKHLLDRKQYELLAPLDWQTIQTMTSSEISFGTHTVRHVVLANEDTATQEKEILQSLEELKKRIHQNEYAFSYPIGERGTFNEYAVRVLKKSGYFCAVTGIAGSNAINQDVFFLKRRSISLYYTINSFLAEVSGVRLR